MAHDAPKEMGEVVDLFRKATRADAEVEVRPAATVEPLEEPLEGEVVPPFYRQTYAARPVLPPWVTDRAERDAARRWAAAYAKHHAAYQAVRVPRYAARLITYTPRGVWRAGSAWARWAFDAESAPLRSKAVESGASGDYLSLLKARDQRVSTRVKVSGGLAAASVTAVGAVWLVWPTAPWVLLVLAVVLLGWHGRPLDKTIVDKAVITGGVAPRLTPTMVVRALGALGIAEINKALGKNGEGITFVCDPCRDGPGWRADVDLPHGVTAGDVIAKRDRLASGLRRPLGCVWPEAAPDEHEGRLVVWVGDKPLRDLKMPAWPLLHDGRADIFRPLPLGVDVRGRPVTLELIFQNLLVGAMPRQGKTFSVRVLALAASLDPTVRFLTHELKGTGDLAPLRKISHRYSSGIIDPAVKSALDSLEYLGVELERRSELIKQINAKNPADCPENKVTRALCDDPRHQLWPVLCLIDEAQNLFAHPVYGERAAELAERVIKVGPALGIILILATQKPNAKSLPTGVKSNVVLRMALRVSDQDTNDMILGTSQYKNGNRATTFSKRDLGIGLLLGETDDPQIVRTYYIDNPTADGITDHARALREEAGTLSGVAAGDVEAIEETAEDLLDHALAVFLPGENDLWNETIVSRLAREHPELYGEWNAIDLGNALSAHGIERRQLERHDEAAGKRRNLRGVDRQTLQDATAKRHQGR